MPPGRQPRSYTANQRRRCGSGFKTQGEELEEHRPHRPKDRFHVSPATEQMECDSARGEFRMPHLGVPERNLCMRHNYCLNRVYFAYLMRHSLVV
jgi:hypothetical protein